MNTRRILLFACALSLLGLSASFAQAEAQGRKFFGKGAPFTLEELPAGKLKTQLQALDPEARGKAMQWLHTFSFEEFDAARHLRVDPTGGIFTVCADTDGCYEGHVHPPTKPAAANAPSDAQAPLAESGSLDKSAPAATPEVAAASVSVNSPPAYHSKPGATRFIYLDFNGGTVSGTAWNSGGNILRPKVWSQDGDRTTFNDEEQLWMKRVWERVAEDYAPFDIDVTTDVAYDPVNYTGDKNKVAWTIICETTDANGVALPHNGSGGVAYVGVFGSGSFYSTYQPAWVTSTNGGGNESTIAE
ncbi:MAG TPA: hypothetical protein VFY13_02120, partial [Luteolibacter sp.]|nr:hypothetical protein [Luteolibacter sp.]